jgi:hypothetical protein
MRDGLAAAQEQYGFERLGPIVAYYLHDLDGILERLVTQRGGQALFVSRGGLLIEEALKAYRASVEAPPRPAEAPFYVSRFLAAKGAWTRAPKQALAVLDRELRSGTAQAYLRRLDPGVDLKIADTRVFRSFSEFMEANGPYQSACRQHLEAQSALFERYFADLAGDRRLSVLVDTGWQGTIQSLLSHAFPDQEFWGANFGRSGPDIDPRIAGRLLGLGFSANSYDARRPLSAFTHHRHLIEALFEPVGESIERLQELDGKVAPIGAEAFSSGRLRPSEPALFDGVLRYLRQTAAALSYAALVREKNHAAERLADDILFPSRETAHLLGSLTRSVDFGSRQLVPVLLDPAQAADPAQPALNPEERIRRALWTQGQIALECRPAIARERQQALLPKKGPVATELPAKGPWNPAAPKVAIIMRTMDRLIFLHRAFESVARQSFDDYVLVIFNDGGDAAAVESELRNSRLDRRKVILLDGIENRGMEAASNAAIRHVNSEYIVIHDDDDSWIANFLATTVDYLDRNKRAAGVVTHAIHVEEEISGDKIVTRQRSPYNEQLRSIQIGELLVGNSYPPISFLFRRSHYDQVGGFNENLPVLGDWDFNLKLAARAEIGVIPEKLANYHFRVSRGDGAYDNSIVGGADLHRRFNAVVRGSLVSDEALKPLAGAIAVAPLLHQLKTLMRVQLSRNTTTSPAPAVLAPGAEDRQGPGGAMYDYPAISSRIDDRLRYNLLSRKRGLRLTWIPKNMCSTLKLSFAVAEGVVAREIVDDFRAHPWWIHNWMSPLEPRNPLDLGHPHSVAVIREPRSRLKSALVEKALYAEDADFNRIVAPLLESYAHYVPRAAEDLTVADLLKALRWYPDHALDPHWQAQSGFLSGRYETLLPMNDPERVSAYFAGHGIDLITVDHHAVSRAIGEPFTLSSQDTVYAARKAMGGQMRPVEFSTELEQRIAELVSDRFASDVALWERVQAG